MPARRLIVGALCVAVGAALIAAMVRYTRRVESDLTHATATSGTVRFLKEPALIPSFTAPDLDGKPIAIADLRGKVVLVNFWATWCPPCREEIPTLIDLQQQYGEQLVVLGVSIDDPMAKLKPYATEMHMNYPVLVGKDRQDVQDAYGPLFGIPVSVFVDRDGRIWKRHSGAA